jgi:mRNA interferase RelE/StbE
MAYSVLFTSAAERSMERLDKSIARRIKPKVLALAENPRPSGCIKLQGNQDLYRIRVGDWRIVYRINDQRRSVEITIVANRREVYRDL